jgi:hypothetical protein
MGVCPLRPTGLAPGRFPGAATNTTLALERVGLQSGHEPTSSASLPAAVGSRATGGPHARDLSPSPARQRGDHDAPPRLDSPAAMVQLWLLSIWTPTATTGHRARVGSKRTRRVVGTESRARAPRWLRFPWCRIHCRALYRPNSAAWDRSGPSSWVTIDSRVRFHLTCPPETRPGPV